MFCLEAFYQHLPRLDISISIFLRLIFLLLFSFPAKSRCFLYSSVYFHWITNNELRTAAISMDQQNLGVRSFAIKEGTVNSVICLCVITSGSRCWFDGHLIFRVFFVLPSCSTHFQNSISTRFLILIVVRRWKCIMGRSFLGVPDSMQSLFISNGKIHVLLHRSQPLHGQDITNRATLQKGPKSDRARLIVTWP